MHTHARLAMRLAAIGFLVASPAGYVSAATVSASSLGPEYVYMEAEYGRTTLRDGAVTTAAGNAYSIFMHRSKSELLVSVSPKRAYGMGFVRGLTLGMAQEKIPRGEFEAAARKWFDQIGRPGCRTTGGRPLNAYYFELHHNCGPWRGTRPRS